MRYLRLSVLAVLATVLLGCAAKSNPASQVDAYTRLQSIPAADPAKFGSVRDFKSWRNPYLMIGKDGASLLDVSNNEEHLLKFDEVPGALARLSPSAWPYGRVVAVAEDKPTGTGDEALIRRNRGVVAGTLESLHILIDWVPAS
jgi:hypothetical protein